MGEVGPVGIGGNWVFLMSISSTDLDSIVTRGGFGGGTSSSASLFVVRDLMAQALPGRTISTNLATSGGS